MFWIEFLFSFSLSFAIPRLDAKTKWGKWSWNLSNHPYVSFSASNWMCDIPIWIYPCDRHKTNVGLQFRNISETKARTQKEHEEIAVRFTSMWTWGNQTTCIFTMRQVWKKKFLTAVEKESSLISFILLYDWLDFKKSLIIFCFFLRMKKIANVLDLLKTWKD